MGTLTASAFGILQRELRLIQMNAGAAPIADEVRKQSFLSRVTAFFVFAFEKVMPDPYVFAVLLTFFGVLLARIYAPNATLPSIASAWYGGIFAIFAFAFQMVIMLVAGYA